MHRVRMDWLPTARIVRHRASGNGNTLIRKKLKLRNETIARIRHILIRIDMEKIIRLPVLNKRLTAEEFFIALAETAKEHPEIFERYVVVWEPAEDSGAERDMAATPGMTVAVANTMLDMAKFDLIAGDYCEE
jgi:hypothetical protein